MNQLYNNRNHTAIQLSTLTETESKVRVILLLLFIVSRLNNITATVTTSVLHSGLMAAASSTETLCVSVGTLENIKCHIETRGEGQSSGSNT